MANLKTYLIAAYNSKNAKKHFISDLAYGINEIEAENSLINKTYYFDYEQKRILGTCRKAIVINEIN